MNYFIKDKKGNEKPWSAFVNFVNPHDIMFFRAPPEILGTGFIGENQKFAPDDPIYKKEHDFDFPKNFIQNVSNKIINNIRGINRVVYDVTSKPPSTIELE